MVVSRNHFDHYTALALQLRCETVNGDGVSDARARIKATLARVSAQVASSCQLLGNAVRLVVLPEYLLTGFPMGEGVEEWTAKAAIALDGPEMAALARIAADNAIFLSCNAYVVDPAFAPLYFQTCLVFDPAGALILRYSRLISMYGPTPLDIWDAYIDRYGIEAVLPVAATAIGRLSAIASEEILYPEIARLAAMAGAEVLLHNSGEIGSPRATSKEVCRLARAVENSAYVISANAASLETGAIPAATTDGMSKIIDYRGLVLSEAGQGETCAANAEIDLAALRRHRTTTGMSAMLARIPSEAFAKLYQRLPAHPAGSLTGPGGAIIIPDRVFFKARQQLVIDKLVAAQRLQLPSK